MSAFRFSSADKLHDEAPRVDAENGYLYAYVRPHTPGVSFSSTVVLDGVVMDVDADQRVTGFEIFPDGARRFDNVRRPQKAASDAMTMWISDTELSQGSMSQTFDQAANLLEVRLHPNDVATRLHRLSAQVSIATSSDKIIAIYISGIDQRVFAPMTGNADGIAR